MITITQLSGAVRPVVRHQRDGHFHEPQKRADFADVDRTDAVGGKLQLYRLLALPRRQRGADFRLLRAHRGRGRSAIGLAIMVLVYRNRNTINVTDLDSLKG